MRKGSPAWLLRYGAGAGSVAVALLLTVLLPSLTEHNTVGLFLVAVLLSTLYGGLGPGLFATTLMALCGAYLFVPPLYSFKMATLNDLAWLGVSVLAALTVSALTAARQRAVEGLQEAYATLEKRMQERTAQLTTANDLLRQEIELRKQVEEALRESAGRYRSLFENANDAIVTVTLDGIVTSVNRGLEVMLGWSREELIDQHYRKFATPAAVALGEERTRRFLVGEDMPSIFETELVRKDGLVIPVEARTRPIRDARGIPLGFQGIYRDITARKQMEEALQQSHAELERRVQERTAELSRANAALQQEIANRIRAEQALQHERNVLKVTLSSIGDGVIATDTTATLNFINPVAETLTGWSAREAIGRDVAEVFHLINEQTRQAVENPVYRVLREGRVVGLANHTLLIARDGREVPVADSGAPIQDANGQLYGTVMVFRDVTESKQAEEALIRAKEAAEAADRIKGEFLATMSHELRTPLHVILGYTDMLIEGAAGDLSPQQVDILRRIDHNSRVLFELISMVLDLNRLETGRLPVDVKEVRVAPFLAEIRAEMQGLCEQSGLAYVWQVAEGLPPLRTDPGKLKVVIKNLLSNAVKFTKEGGVTVSACGRGGGVEICVADTGIGIPPEARAIIFEPFRQVDSSDTRPYSGSGLGLHIVKRLLEVLGGTVTVDSEVGRGSTFRVWLPASIAPGPAGEGTNAGATGKGDAI